jgi:hypothetical protein
MEEGANSEAGAGGSVLPLYLGLFLSLLAFFILFIGRSMPDAGWSAGGATTGADPMVPATASRDADIVALSAVAGAFLRLGGEMAGSAADETTGLDLDVPARAVFADRRATIRPAAIAAIDRSATALATPRGDQRLVLQVMIGLGNGADTAAIVHRAAGLAALLLQRGAPPDAFVAGAGPVGSGDIHFRFRLVRNADDLVAAF